MFCPYKEECRENGVEHGRIFSTVGIEAANITLSEAKTHLQVVLHSHSDGVPNESFLGALHPPRAERRNSASPPLLLLLPLPLASGMKYSSAAELT